MAAERLRNQLNRPPPRAPDPSRPRTWSPLGLGAVQAQEYPFAKWALALRLAGDTTDADIEQDFDAGRILRTHVLRPTWHFVAPDDIGWMLELTGPRVHRLLASLQPSAGARDQDAEPGSDPVRTRASAAATYLTRASWAPTRTRRDRARQPPTRARARSTPSSKA